MCKIYLLLAISILVLGCSGCKKDNNENAGPQIAFEKQDYYPLEAALITVKNTTVSDGQYTGSIDGTSIKLVAVNGYLGTVMPVLNAGTHRLSVTVNGQVLSAGFNLLASPTISDPDAVYNSNYQNVTSGIQTLNLYLDSLSSATDKINLLADIATLQHFQDSMNQVYNTLTPEGKKNCALYLTANSWWLADLEAAITACKTAVSFKTQNAVEDYEIKLRDAREKMLAANEKAINAIDKIEITTICFATLGAIPSYGIGAGEGALVGVVLGVLTWGKDISTRKAVAAEYLDLKAHPVESTFESKKTNAVISFTNNTYRQLTTTLTFRTLYDQDANSSNPLETDIIQSFRGYKVAYNKIKGKLPYELQSTAVAIEDIPTYSTESINISSNHLAVTDISNNAVSFAGSDRTDGYYKVRFTTNAQTDQSFTFKLNYLSDYGATSIVIDATITPNPIVGTWNLYTWGNGYAPGQYIDNPPGGACNQLMDAQTVISANLTFNANGTCSFQTINGLRRYNIIETPDTTDAPCTLLDQADTYTTDINGNSGTYTMSGNTITVVSPTGESFTLDYINNQIVGGGGYVYRK